MLFSTLEESLRGGASISLTVTKGAAGSLVVVATPSGDAAAHPHLGAGLVLEGTAAEFDAELAGHLRGWLTTRRSLEAQVQAAAAILNEARQQVAAQTHAKTAKPATALPGAATAPKLPAPARGAVASARTDDQVDEAEEGDDAEIGGDTGQGAGAAGAVSVAPGKPVLADPVNLF
jgi:PRTRC genetic system protein E